MTAPSTTTADRHTLRRVLSSVLDDFQHITLFPSMVEGPTQDFEEYRRVRTILVVRAALLFGVALMLILLPTDFLLYSKNPGVLRTLLAARLSLIVLSLIFYTFLRQVPVARSTLLVLAAGTLISAAVLYLCGEAGDPSKPFVYNIIFLPVISIPFLVPLRLRIGLATLSTFAGLAAYFGPHPSYWHFPYVNAILLYGAASLMLCSAIGHLLYRLEYGSFLQRRRIREDMVKLEELNKLKDSFIATVSHELRTPLNAIIGLTDVVLDEKLSPEVQQYLRTIHGSGETLLSIINDILDIAKIRSGKLDLESTPFSPYDLVESVAGLFAANCEKKGLQISFFAPVDLPWLVGDPVRMNQVLLNLVGNAVKFTEHGEIRIVASWEQRENGQPWLSIAVADTGPGIPSGKRELIFEEFTQGDVSTTRKYGGTGLGLSIVRRLARLLGGEVTVSDNLPRGSVFTLSLPAVIADSPSDSNAWLPDRILKSAPVALICSIHPLRLRHASSLLGRMGFAVEEVPTLDAALRCLRRLKDDGRGPALTLIDQPGLTPDRLRRSGILELPTSVLRGIVLKLDIHSLTQDGPVYRTLGIHALVSRPATRLQLRQAIESLFSVPSPASPLSSVAVPQNGPPARLLVVEDVRENQFLISAFLAKLPVEPTFADNGAQGLERFTRERFDLVLLDIEMPEMDGYEALAHMRAWEEEHQATPTPIVALTAHGSFEHQERARNAGFSHHLTKPVRKRDFLWLLEHFVYTPVAQRSSVISRQISSDSLPAVSPEALLLRSSYLHRRRTEITEMQDLLCARNFQKLHRIGHNLKGSGASYGLLDISAIGREIEEAAHKGDELALRDLVEELNRSIDKYV